MQSENQNKAPVPITMRKSGIYPVLDKYILREFMIPFTLLILAFVILFVIGDIFNDLEDFLSSKRESATLANTIIYFLLKIPGNIRFILPITILLSCMYTMANFGKNMEITAMRSSGVSLMRCGGSIFLVGLIVTMVLFALNEKVVPATERKAFILLKLVSKGEDRIKRMYSMLSYRSPDKKRTWLFEYFSGSGDKKNLEHQNVTVKFHRPDGMLNWDLHAEKARYTSEGWLFTDVVTTQYSKDGLMPKSPVKHKDMLIPLKDIPETPKQITDSIKPPEELPSWSIFQLLRKTENMAQQCKDIYLTTLFYRLAFPWSCFLAVFLGIPLATKNERSGIFMAIITAVIVIVVYQITTHIFLILGKQGHMNPLIAGLSPTIAFIIYGWYNVARRV